MQQSKALGHSTHQVVSRVRDNRAEDTSDVTGSKGDPELLHLVTLLLGLGHHILVQRHHRVLKAGCVQHTLASLEGVLPDSAKVW